MVVKPIVLENVSKITINLNYYTALHYPNLYTEPVYF
jgi:hypothetical protein